MKAKILQILFPAFLSLLLASPITVIAASDNDLSKISRSKSYAAIAELTSLFTADIGAIAAKLPKVTLARYSQSKSFPSHLREYLVNRIEQSTIFEKKDSKNKKTLTFMRCVGCFKPRALTDGRDIYIRKGFVDNSEMLDALKRLGVDGYLTVHLDSSDDEIIMQVGAYSIEDQKLVYSREYKILNQGPARSGFVMGISIQSMIFHESDLPAPMGGRLTMGQRLVGLGDVGVSATYMGALNGLPSQTTFGFYTDLNYNEISGKHWKYVTLIYPLEFGVTDFNGDTQIQLQAGMKFRFGSALYLGITERVHVFMSEPKNDGVVGGSDKDPESGYFDSDEAIPAHLMFGIGVDFTF